MTMLDTDAPDAVDVAPSVDSGDLEPSDSTATPPAPAATDPEVKKLRDRLSEEGRVRQAHERQISTLSAQVQTLSEQLGAINANLSQQEQARMDAYLESLPPEQRLQAKIDVLTQRLDAVSTPTPAQPAVTRESKRDYTLRRAREMADEVNTLYGLDGDEALTGQEQGLDWSTEQSYKKSLAKLARQRALGQSPPSGDTVASKKQTPNAQPSRQDVVEDVTAKVMRNLGISSPSSPRPAGGRTGEVTSDTFQRTLKGYSPKTGPRATVAALKEQVAQAEKNLR